VRPISLDRAREMVRRHHYARGGSNTAVYTFGLLPRRSIFEFEAVAATWWLPPTKVCGAGILPANPQGVLALSRLVCEPNAPKNAASFILRHSMRMIDRVRWPALVTFADEWKAHTGAIYLAAGWKFAGYTKPERTYTKAGRMISRKRGPVTLTHSQMLADGCDFVGSFRRLRFIHHRGVESEAGVRARGQMGRA
jgi:hypothetical protein